MTPLEIAIKAAVSAGDILTTHYGKIAKLRQKESLRDMVTEIDTLSEKEIISIISENDPTHGILTEESGFVGPKTDDYWVVDALDGTVNYIHQVPLFSVSIAFFSKGKPTLGAIYNPLAEDLYYGSLETGSFKNQKKLTLKDSPLKESLISMAFSGKAYHPETRHKGFELFGTLNDQSQGCLRTGSAAMNLAYVADGKLGVAVGKANKLWDIAAGLVIAQAAGAKVTYTHINADKHLADYIAATPTCHKELTESVDLSYLEL